MVKQRSKKANDVNGVFSQARDIASGSGIRRVPKVVNKRNPSASEIKIGTWNVRTMLRNGKLENVQQEMMKNGINILGLSEVRWKEVGDFMSNNIRVIYAGGNESQRGVAVLLDNETAKRVTTVVQHSDRLILVKIQAEPVDIVIIQVYMPTSTHSDEEVEDVYEQLEELMAAQKGSDYLVVMGDWNAIVGEGREENEIGQYGLGSRNDRGEKLVEFCRQKKLTAANTWFKHEKRRRYTWKKPGDTGRYQLDYILVRQRYRNSIKNACSYPGADADSDHNLVAMRVAVKLKKLQMTKKREKKWDVDQLKTKEKAFAKEIDSKLGDTRGYSVEKRWTEIKKAVTESAKSVIGYAKRKPARKAWVTNEMLEKMEERRKWKNVKSEEGKRNYRQLNNELRRQTDRARENWWERECKELEEMDKRGRSDLMYAKVSQITMKPKSCSSATINDNNGKPLTDPHEIQSRWKEYIETLYDKNGKPNMDDIRLEEESHVQPEDMGPQLLDSEIKAAINEMKNNKAEGVDGIPAEFWKVLGDKAMRELVKLCKDMYEKGEWPKDFTRMVMIPLQKKPNATECGDYRTISLIPHASKIMLKILTKRIESKARNLIGRNQFGFRKGCGTREAIGTMRVLCERSIEHDNDVYICFIDFEKAFDRVNWVKMMDALKSIGVDWRDRRLIKELKFFFFYFY